MSLSRKGLLDEMGLSPQWVLREASPNTHETKSAQRSDSQSIAIAQEAVQENVPGVATSSVNVAQMDWPTLRQTIQECRACGLCSKRRQAVPGVGDEQASWLFIGEGPGAEEDARGEPFVGQAGKLLDSMLAAIDLARGEDVYIANAVKCRPPENRTPEPTEIDACRPYLAQQIALIRPRMIVALGRPAAQALLKTEVKIAAVRGRLHEYQGISLVITYHPAYLLRNLTDKAKAWEDLCFMRHSMRRLKGS